MVQKHYRIEDLKELKWHLEEIRELEEYNRAKTVLVQAFVESWDEALIRRIISAIRAKLPEAKLAGITTINREIYDGFPTGRADDHLFESLVLDVLCFKSSTVDVKTFEIGDLCELGNGGQLGLYLSGLKDTRGVHVLAVGEDISVDNFLAMAAAENPDVIFYGESASRGYRVTNQNRIAKGCAFGDEGIITNGFVAVVFSGEDLHFRAGYNMGWTPVGKKMTITKTEGEKIVCEIDGHPAADIYKKYLGLSPEQLTVDNVCEFPFGVKRGNRIVACTGLYMGDTQKLCFTIPVYEDDEIQFSYGNPDTIFEESFDDAVEVNRFAPQAIELVACLNRTLLLKKDVETEHGFFREIIPELNLVHGNSEILYDSEGGGELNSTLISIAMREGNAPVGRHEDLYCDKSQCPFHQQTMPLIMRMTNFLQATTHDMEEEVRKAKEANAAKTRFLSSVSHEIRTPINAVLGLDEMILRESSEKQIRQYAMDIQNSGRTLLSLINDLLDSSRIDSGRMEIIPVEYELSSLLNDLVNMTGVRANEKKLDFNVNVSQDIPHVLYGDDTRIKQCALNILTNAVKYTEEGGVTMNVSAQKKDEKHIALTFSVEDTGIGIKEEDIEKLYKPFLRIEEERNKNIEGTGLGMNIVLALLKMMDSELKVESVYGKGSVFSFTVVQKVIKWDPIGDFSEMYRESVETSTNYHESFRAPDARILVVDDTRMNLTVIRGLLKATQIQIDTAESGREALSLVSKYEYDIIFLDQRMPQMDGIETLRRMKHSYDNKNHGVPVIMLTANAMSGAREMFLEEGFDDYLTKPINGKKLEKAIAERLPKEKLLPPSDEEPNESEPAEKSPFLAALSAISEISVKEGLDNCLNEEILKATISDYVVGAKENPAKILGFLEKGDIENYTITVHALKSSSGIIGAEALSELAKHLEAMGDAKNIEEIKAKTPKLIEIYKELADRLSAALEGKDASAKKDEVAEEEAELSQGEVESALSGVKELVEAFDFDGAADIIKMLSGYRLTENIKKRLTTISDHITKLERDEILEEL